MSWKFSSGDGDDFHICLVIGGFALAIPTFVTQMRKPAPWGRFDGGTSVWGPRVPQRLGHILNDGLYGVIFFLWILLRNWNLQGNITVIFVLAWLAHFIHRGFIHPLIMNYSRKDVTIGIPISGLTLAYFSYLHADFFIKCHYDRQYYLDIRFLFGSFLFVLGFSINRSCDLKLRSLRFKSGNNKYTVPYGGIFNLVSCPNYFGEMVQWFGWAIAIWAPCAFAYFLFTTATFIPRAHFNHNWYLHNFPFYPKSRKSLIPFLI